MSARPPGHSYRRHPLCPCAPALVRAPEKRHVSVSTPVLTPRCPPTFASSSATRAPPNRLIHTTSRSRLLSGTRAPTTRVPCSFDPLFRSEVRRALGIPRAHPRHISPPGRCGVTPISIHRCTTPRSPVLVLFRGDGDVDLRADDDTLPFPIASHRFPALSSSVYAARSRVLTHLPTGTPTLPWPHISSTIMVPTCCSGRRSLDPHATCFGDRDARALSRWDSDGDGLAKARSLSHPYRTPARSLPLAYFLYGALARRTRPLSSPVITHVFAFHLPRDTRASLRPSHARASLVYPGLLSPRYLRSRALKVGQERGAGVNAKVGMGMGTEIGPAMERGREGDEQVGGNVGTELRGRREGKAKGGRWEKGRRRTKGTGLSDGVVWLGVRVQCKCGRGRKYAGVVQTRARARGVRWDGGDGQGRDGDGNGNEDERFRAFGGALSSSRFVRASCGGLDARPPVPPRCARAASLHARFRAFGSVASSSRPVRAPAYTAACGARHLHRVPRGGRDGPACAGQVGLGRAPSLSSLSSSSTRAPASGPPHPPSPPLVIPVFACALHRPHTSRGADFLCRMPNVRRRATSRPPYPRSPAPSPLAPHPSSRLPRPPRRPRIPRPTRIKCGLGLGADAVAVCARSLHTPTVMNQFAGARSIDRGKVQPNKGPVPAACIHTLDPARLTLGKLSPYAKFMVRAGTLYGDKLTEHGEVLKDLILGSARESYTLSSTWFNLKQRGHSMIQIRFKWTYTIVGLPVKNNYMESNLPVRRVFLQIIELTTIYDVVTRMERQTLEPTGTPLRLPAEAHQTDLMVQLPSRSGNNPLTFCNLNWYLAVRVFRWLKIISSGLLWDDNYLVASSKPAAGRAVIWSFSVKIGKFEQKMVKMTIFWRRL
ncbi:hypothetical protein C8F04DRAFT_1186350 [Mycena alexandri]|uniref:Uncharacterized protein n=1 Tax=Mycena alexandri TaxID=1745969 RepID=A0AAD6SMV6_9AGAR|nr:hypothetical protein C8F04DRAFT_1186350 [Mycena alexandri]